MSEEKVYELLVEGLCKGVPVDGGLSKTRAGDEQYVIKFKITHGDGEKTKNVGKHVTWWGGFKGEGMKYTTKSLEAVGWDGASDLASFKPKGEVEIMVEHRTMPAQGDKPAKKIDGVKFFNSLDGSGGQTLGKLLLSPDEAKAASVSLMARIRAHKEANGGGDASAATATAMDAFEMDPKETLPF